MAIQLSDAARNASLDSIETTAGTAVVMRLLTGAVPANCAAAETGTIVGTLPLPTDWMAVASGGAKAKLGTWQDVAADNAGTVSYFRIYNSGITVCHIQGTVTITSGGGDMELDNNVVTLGQTITITSFTLTDGNP